MKYDTELLKLKQHRITCFGDVDKVGCVLIVHVFGYCLLVHTAYFI
jgi:hypothetical protein